MRILHIIPTLEAHGAEKQLTLLATHLPRERFDVHVCCLMRGGTYERTLRQAGVPVASIGQRWAVDPAAWWRLRRHIQRLRPDVVHAWRPAGASYGRTAAFSAGVRRVIATVRSVDPSKTTLELAMDLWLARRTVRIVVNGRAVHDFHVARGLPAEKLVVIPSGVCLAPPSPVTRDELLQELGLPVGNKLIGAVNRLTPQKRVKELIWAADQLKCLLNNVHLLIVGEGPQRAALERYRRLNQIEDRVHFLGARADVPRIMPHFDVLWLASGYEGQSTAILEAMAAGVPVVATDIPGNRELVVPGETGFLARLDNRSDFARKTLPILEDPALGAGLGAAGRERVEREFSVSTMVEGYAELYDGL